MKRIRGSGCIYGKRKEEGIVREGYWFSRICGLYCIIKKGMSR